MKIAVLLFLTMSCISVLAANTNNFRANTEVVKAESKWPTDARGLVEHLNTWDKNELDVLERPDFYKGQKASSETAGWANSHKEKLRALGTAVAWNSDKMLYEIQSEKKSKRTK